MAVESEPIQDKYVTSLRGILSGFSVYGALVDARGATQYQNDSFSPSGKTTFEITMEPQDDCQAFVKIELTGEAATFAETYWTFTEKLNPLSEFHAKAGATLSATISSSVPAGSSPVGTPPGGASPSSEAESEAASASVETEETIRVGKDLVKMPVKMKGGIQRPPPSFLKPPIALTVQVPPEGLTVIVEGACSAVTTESFSTGYGYSKAWAYTDFEAKFTGFYSCKTGQKHRPAGKFAWPTPLKTEKESPQGEKTDEERMKARSDLKTLNGMSHDEQTALVDGFVKGNRKWPFKSELFRPNKEELLKQQKAAVSTTRQRKKELAKTNVKLGTP